MKGRKHRTHFHISVLVLVSTVLQGCSCDRAIIFVGDAEEDYQVSEDSHIDDPIIDGIFSDDEEEIPLDFPDDEPAIDEPLFDETEEPFLLTWAKTYGGPDHDEPRSFQQTSDGGFIIAGFTESFGGRLNSSLILKLNAAGEIEWQKNYRGDGYTDTDSIQETSDGGCIVVGTTTHEDADSMPYGWALRLDVNGDVVWKKIRGMPNYSSSLIKPALDAGYIIAGTGICLSARCNRVIIHKLDENGNGIWKYSYADEHRSRPRCIQQTPDSGYIVTGEVVDLEERSRDILVLRLDGTGNIEWQKTYGGPDDDWASSIQYTSDNGYIIAGTTDSFGAGYDDIWVLKLDGGGNVEWQKTYGGVGPDEASSVRQIPEDGFIVAGKTFSFGAGYFDIWVLKLDESGNVTWQKTYGDESDDWALSIELDPDGGYFIAGATLSFGAGHYDIWILKMDDSGNISEACPPGIGMDSSAVVTETLVSPQDASFSMDEDNATLSEMSASSDNTEAIVDVQCGR